MLVDSPLRLVQIVRQFGQGGGIEHVAYELHQAWRGFGIDSRVLTISSENEADQPQLDFVATWTRWISTRGLGRYVGKLVVIPLFTIVATLTLRRNSGDRLVVSHGDSLGGDICVVHAVNRASIAEKRRLGQRAWMLNPLHAWTAIRDRYMIGGLRFRRYVAISNRIARELQEHYDVPADRIALIPNGVNTDRFRPQQDMRGRIRESFGIPLDAAVLLFVGHEFERKGLSYVIQTLEHLPANVYVLVVGGGNPLPYIAIAQRSCIPLERVVYAGHRLDLENIYPIADAFVFPTYYEAFGLVCMEAMACGIPLFATQVGGIEDYLIDGVNGRFIERNAADIARCLLPALTDKILWNRMSAAARTTAESYTWPMIAAQYLDLLRVIKAERGAGPKTIQSPVVSAIPIPIRAS